MSSAWLMSGTWSFGLSTLGSSGELPGCPTVLLTSESLVEGAPPLVLAAEEPAAAGVFWKSNLCVAGTLGFQPVAGTVPFTDIVARAFLPAGALTAPPGLFAVDFAVPLASAAASKGTNSNCLGSGRGA